MSINAFHRGLLDNRATEELYAINTGQPMPVPAEFVAFADDVAADGWQVRAGEDERGAFVEFVPPPDALPLTKAEREERRHQEALAMLEAGWRPGAYCTRDWNAASEAADRTRGLR